MHLSEWAHLQSLNYMQEIVEIKYKNVFEVNYWLITDKFI